MKEIKFFTFFAALLVLALMMVAPVNAATPTVNSDVWFVAVALTGTGGQVSYTDGGTVIHHTGLTGTWNLSRSLVMIPGKVTIIGNMSDVTDFDYNFKTGIGSAITKITLQFNEPDTTKNPYGVGTLVGTAISSVRSVNLMNSTFQGNGTGVLIATSGTGAFANAMLTADFIRAAFPNDQTPVTYAMYFGTHPMVHGSGILTYNSLQGSYRDFKVMLHNGRVYVLPPQYLTHAPLIMSIGTWDQDFYSRIGMTPIDAAKPSIDDLMSCPYIR